MKKLPLTKSAGLSALINPPGRLETFNDGKQDFLGAAGNPLVNAYITKTGLGLMNLSSPMLRGKHRFYHGTSRQGAEAIMREGIKTMGVFDPDKTTMSALLKDMPEVAEESRNMAFGDKRKRISKTFASQAQGMRDGGLTHLEYKMKYIEDAFDRPFKTVSDILLGRHTGRVVKFEIPDRLRAGIKTNPELPYALRGARNHIFPEFFVKRLAKATLGSSRGIEGGVAPELVKGNKNFRLFDAVSMKLRPSRVLRGGLLGLGGLGLAAYGVGDTVNQFKNAN